MTWQWLTQALCSLSQVVHFVSPTRPMRLVIILTVLCSAAMVVPIEARAGALAFDAAGNLFLADGHSISKYAPDGTKSTFAAGLSPLSLSFDGKGNLFVVDESSILKFTPDGKRGRSEEHTSE